jgi:transcriptional regulator of met regulon
MKLLPTDLSVANILKKVISLAVKIKPVPTNSSVANNLEKARSITNTLMICDNFFLYI